ncbi:MAG: sulfatase, partial [Ignavibacteriae bacterium]|nr:sulfatase [Ignavibacteriota bacterium]
MKKITGYLVVIIVLTLAYLLYTSIKTKKKKPNILFIAIDDLRPELGCYGNEIIQTPNIDKLASQGRIFTNHYVQVPTCGASRLSLLTGYRPKTTSQLRNSAIVEEISNIPQSDKPETFIHHLRKNGYYTVGMGKISHSPDNLVYGYTEQPSTKKELPNSWDEFLFNSGKWETGWNSFFAYANGENRQSMKRQVKPYEVGEVDDDGYPDGLTTQLALEKLNELKEKETPFFLGVGFFKPHLPFNAPKKYWDLYNRDSIPLSPTPFIPKNVNKASLHNSGEFNGYQLTDEKASLDKPISDEYARKLRHGYFACVRYIDAQIGKLLNELELLNLTDNTIIVLWGDHGWHLGDHLVWGKHTIFEYALKSALIIKTPDMPNPGISSKEIVETVDIYPTIMELCDIDIHNSLDGNSFTDLLNDPMINKDDPAYSYYNNGISVRTDQYRLTKYFREEQPVTELFDYENDPNETENIADQNPQLVNE